MNYFDVVNYFNVVDHTKSIIQWDSFAVARYFYHVLLVTSSLPASISVEGLLALIFFFFFFVLRFRGILQAHTLVAVCPSLLSQFVILS